MEADEINKNSWRPKFTSEFSMGQFDFARLDKTLTETDRLAGLVTSTDLPSLEMMQQFFAQLKNLYDNFRPIISHGNVTKELDAVVEEGKKRKRIWENAKRSGIPFSQVRILEFVDLMDAFKTRLYSLKQVIGLGIQVRRNMSISEKIRQGVHGNKDFDNLPEA
jgi:phospholipid N-methyltransferase